MALDFPNSPSVNDSFSAAGKTWVYNGIKWVLLGTSLSQTVKDGSVTQAKLAAFLSAVTVTTTANRSSAVPSPFTGQLVFLTDTKKMQVWDGSLWLNITLAPPEPPTSLSAIALSGTSISVSFTAGGANGSPITNYKYALSTNGGSSYGAFTVLNPADATSPITISGLTAATTYHIKLKAVNDMGDSVESSATSVGTLSTPDAPTGLSASNITTTTVDISFTAGAQNGSAISNYQYALSTNGGSSYGSFTALNPADASSPITITGLTHTTTYYAKLKAVNNDGAGQESSAVSFTTLASTFAINYLVVAGGGAGGTGYYGGGGGAGGYRSSMPGELSGRLSGAESTSAGIVGTAYTVTVGGGGSRSENNSTNGSNGQNSVFGSITSTGGGAGGSRTGTETGYPRRGADGGSGGGSSYAANGGTGTAAQGFDGAGNSGGYYGNGGGGAGEAGQLGLNQSPYGARGGNGLSSSITGSSVAYAGGGAGGQDSSGSGTNGGSGGGGGGAVNFGSGTSRNAIAGTANTGGGGGGGSGGDGSETQFYGAAGGSGVVILRYPSGYIITVGSGLSYSHINEVISGGYKYTRITAGSGNVSWS